MTSPIDQLAQYRAIFIDNLDVLPGPYRRAVQSRSHKPSWQAVETKLLASHESR